MPNTNNVSGNQEIKGGSSNFGDVTNIHNHSAPQKIVVDTFGFTPNHNFTRRKKEIDDIKAELLKNNVIVIQGIGGIGKTSIAKQVTQEIKTDKSKIYFLNIENGLTSKLSDLVMQEMDYRLIKQTVANELNLQDVIIILDNAVISDIKDITEFVSMVSNAKVILTSRSAISEYVHYELKKLSPDEAMAIFKSHLDEHNVNESDIKTLVGFCANVPLVVEIIAKQTKEYLSYKQPIQNIIAKFSNETIAKLNIKLSRDGVNDEDIAKLLTAIFKPSEISDDTQKAILTAVANLSADGIDGQTLKEWLEIDKDTFINTSNKLASLGWIYNDSGVLSTHRAIKEVVNSSDILQTTTINTLWYILLTKFQKCKGAPITAKPYVAHAQEFVKILDESENLALFYNNLATIYQAIGDLPKALEYSDKSLELRLKLFGEEHSSVATSYNNLGLIYRDMGDLPKALEYYDKSLELYIKLLGEEHSSVATSYNNLGQIYQDMKDLPKALEYSDKALKLLVKLFGEEHPNVASSYNNLASIYKDMEDLPKALEHANKSLKLRLKLLGEEHPSVATSYNNLGRIYKDMKDLPKALEYSQKSLELRLKLLGEEHPSVAIVKDNLRQISMAIQAQKI